MSDSKAGPKGTTNVTPAAPSPASGAVASAPPVAPSDRAREREKREPPPMQHSMHMEQKKVPPEILGTPRDEL